jgi:hypothetical protein
MNARPVQRNSRGETGGRLVRRRLSRQHDTSLDHLENEQRLLGALDAGEREQLAGLLRKLLVSPPIRELDPAIAGRATVAPDLVRPPNTAASAGR